MQLLTRVCHHFKLIIQILLAGKEFAQISAVTLVELETGQITHKSTTQSVLDTLKVGIQFNYLTI